jgi:acetyltransferase-like isoleucine patch superfamily enzyme
MKLKRSLRAVPIMAKFLWLDWHDYILRLYVRASWKIQGLSLSPLAAFHYENRSHIKIDGQCSVGPFSVIMVAQKNEKVSPLLIIGDKTYIGDQVNIRAAGGVIKIGREVLIANHVTIVSSNHGTKHGEPMSQQAWRRGDVIIEDDVWVGAGVIVLPGAIIRKGAVIGAGAVVRGEVPANSIYGGIPARQIGVRS